MLDQRPRRGLLRVATDGLPYAAPEEGPLAYVLAPYRNRPAATASVPPTDARMAEGVAPAVALAKHAGQTVNDRVAGAQRIGKRVKRLRIEMAETELHARSMHETDHLYERGPVKMQASISTTFS